MLEVRRLTKYDSAIPAIRDVSFTSTTVSILTGLLEPSGGGICVDGIDVSDRMLEHKGRIGYVPEEAHLYSYLSGPEYLALIGRLRLMPEARLQRKIAAFLDIFGLTDARHAPMSAYSKGMRQKILISAALPHDPQILVLDEPNSGLDVTTSLVLRSLVRALAAEGRMVLYCSHVLEIVEQIATDVLILQEGRVAAHGSVGELRRMMASPTLEQVFRRLVVATDVDGLARTLMDVMKA